jgi:hypothetical protein
MNAYSLLSNSIYIFTIVSAFFWLTHTQFSLENRRKVNVLIFFFVLLGTYEYWILGDRSFLSFSGDLEYSIPNFKTLSAQPDGEKFIHGLAGGADRDAVVAIGGQIFSFESFIIDWLPLGLASFLHFTLAVSISLIGMYRLCRSFQGCSRELSLATAVLFSFGSPYSWDMGFGTAIIPLVCYIFVCRLGKQKYFISVVTISLLNAVSCTPTFSVLSLVGALLVVAIVHGYKSFIKILPALGILVFAILLNWHESLFAKYLIAPYTYRGNIFHEIPFGIESINIFVGLGIAGSFLSFFANRNKGFRIILAVMFGLFMPLIAYISVIYLPILSPLKPLSFSYLAAAQNVFLLLALIIGISLAEDAKLLQNLRMRSQIIISRSFLFTIIGAMALAQFAVLKVQTPIVWLIEGGLSTLTGAMNQLEDRPWLPSKPVRVVSVRYRLGGSYAAAAGLDTFDGMINITSITPYWKAILKSSKVYMAQPGLRLDNLDFQCCDYYDLNKFADIDLLRIANVGYVLSIVPIIGSGITQVAGPQGIGDLPRSYHGVFERLQKSVRQIIFSSKIRVYALEPPLERIYPIYKLIVSKANNSEKDFFALIKNNALNKNAIVRERDLPVGLDRNEGTLILERWALIKNGVTIDVKSGSGFVVFNSPYLPFWNAYADGKKQKTFSVNEAQMAAYIPENTKRFNFKYDRPNLKDTILQTLR